MLFCVLKVHEPYSQVHISNYKQFLLPTYFHNFLHYQVDPKKVTSESVIPKNRLNLILIVQMTWTRIIQSPMAFPPELRQCFVLFRERLKDMSKDSLSDKLISASIFLRFLCPAILNPSLFNITQELPNEKATRNLTLVAKTLQTLANFTKFQGKEQFMEFMNEFIEQEQDNMKLFLKKISSRSQADQRALEYSGEIDLGIQLSVLQTLLSECLPNMKPSNDNEQYYRDTLQKIIQALVYAKSHPNNDLVQSLSSNPSSSSASATMIDHQKQEQWLQKLQPLTQNVFRYNDPTATPLDDNYHEIHQRNDNVAGSFNYVDAGGSGNMQSQQQHTGDYKKFIKGPVGLNSSSVTVSDPPSTPRSSTLPRNAYLGSGRTPAMDLHTADDYVHYSALGIEDNEDPAMNQKSNHPIGHSFSHNHIPSDSPNHPHQLSGSSTPVYQQRNNQSHHQHFHNHTRYNTNSNNNNNNQAPPFNTGQPQYVNSGHVDDSLNSSHDYDQNSTGDADNNMKGSQTSISQLSNIGSSGYQSFAYSQSSSPVDPVITHNDVTNNNNNTNQKNVISSINNISNNNNSSNGLMTGDSISVAQMPQITQVLQPPPQVAALAFNNPMYHLNASANNFPRPNNNNKIHPSQVLPHHMLINSSSPVRSYPIGHSQSSNVANYSTSSASNCSTNTNGSGSHHNQHFNHNGNNMHHCGSSLSSAQSVEDLVCARVTLSGSDDSASLVSTTSTPPTAPQQQQSGSVDLLSRHNSGYNNHIANSNNIQGISSQFPQHHSNNSFKSAAPRTNPRYVPHPNWPQQGTNLISSITNIPSSVNSVGISSNNSKAQLDHHHSTSDLLATSATSYANNPRRTPHKGSRRQSAEFTSSRQRLMVLNNYDSTSDDTSSDERQGSHHPHHHNLRQRHHNNAPNNVSSNMNALAANRASVNRVSDSKSLEEVGQCFQS